MNIKKYRLGNKPEEYELRTDYLGWSPKDGTDWTDFLFPFTLEKDVEVVICSLDKKEEVTLILHQQIIKDAFPMSFYGEERAKSWSCFCIVSKKDNLIEKFIIPLH